MESVESVDPATGNNDIKQATTNAGVLHSVQDDDVKQRTANATATADRYGMTNKGTSNGNCNGKDKGNGNGKDRGPSLRSG
jgi:hypothetical protein